MTNRKAAAKAAFVPAVVASDDVSVNRVDVIARLSTANAKERILILSALPMGEVAAIGGRIANIGASVNEVLNIKLCEKHGNDWAHIAKMMPSELGDTDKERRKAIIASLESIRETVKANTGGRDDVARNTLRRVKEFGLGIRKSKSAPKANEKRELRTFLLSWDAMPSVYRRIMKDEGATETEMVLADAIATFFKECSISPQSVIDCAGRSSWNH